MVPTPVTASVVAAIVAPHAPTGNALSHSGATPGVHVTRGAALPTTPGCGLVFLLYRCLILLFRCLLGILLGFNLMPPVWTHLKKGLKNGGVPSRCHLGLTERHNYHTERQSYVTVRGAIADSLYFMCLATLLVCVEVSIASIYVGALSI